MKRKRGMSLIIAAVSVAFCAGWSYFENSTESDAASLTIVNASEFIAEIKAFKVASNCSGGKQLLNRQGVVLGRESLNIKLNPNQEFSFFLSVGQYIGHEIRDTNAICIVPITFKPASNGVYVATFTDVPNPKRNCRVNIVKLEEGIAVDDVTVRERKWKTAFLESGSFCKKD